jgi:hypothetical protein
MQQQEFTFMPVSHTGLCGEPSNYHKNTNSSVSLFVIKNGRVPQTKELERETLNLFALQQTADGNIYLKRVDSSVELIPTELGNIAAEQFRKLNQKEKEATELLRQSKKRKPAAKNDGNEHIKKMKLKPKDFVQSKKIISFKRMVNSKKKQVERNDDQSVVNMDMPFQNEAFQDNPVLLQIGSSNNQTSIVPLQNAACNAAIFPSNLQLVIPSSVLIPVDTVEAHHPVIFHNNGQAMTQTAYVLLQNEPIQTAFICNNAQPVQMTQNVVHKNDTQNHTILPYQIDMTNNLPENASEETISVEVQPENIVTLDLCKTTNTGQEKHSHTRSDTDISTSALYKSLDCEHDKFLDDILDLNTNYGIPTNESINQVVLSTKGQPKEQIIQNILAHLHTPGQPESVNQQVSLMSVCILFFSNQC